MTPYPELEAFIGKDALDATLSEPIDDMIARGGGLDASLQGGQNHVEEYQNTLKNKAALTAELRNDKMTDQWIDTYFLSVQAGSRSTRASWTRSNAGSFVPKRRAALPISAAAGRFCAGKPPFASPRDHYIALRKGNATNYLCCGSIGKFT